MNSFAIDSKLVATNNEENINNTTQYFVSIYNNGK